MNKGGFSWKKLSGISAVKSKISRKTGVPLTRGGRNQKIGKIVSGGGCLLMISSILLSIMLTLSVVLFGL